MISYLQLFLNSNHFNLPPFKPRDTAKAFEKLTVPDGQMMSKVHEVRGYKVMLDHDLAALYHVGIKQFKEAVQGNIGRFPPDFLFELTAEEFESLSPQIAASKKRRGETTYPPMAFTEQGVAMLSGILNNEMAILANIQVIRVFTRIRQLFLNQKDFLLRLEKIEGKQTIHTRDVARLFEYLKMLITLPKVERRRVGFRRKGEE